MKWDLEEFSNAPWLAAKRLQAGAISRGNLLTKWADNWREQGTPVTVGKSASRHLFLGFVVVSSIWLQFILAAVGSTVKTRDLVKLNNNSIPAAPTTYLIELERISNFL